MTCHHRFFFLFFFFSFSFCKPDARQFMSRCTQRATCSLQARLTRGQCVRWQFFIFYWDSVQYCYTICDLFFYQPWQLWSSSQNCTEHQFRLRWRVSALNHSHTGRADYELSITSSKRDPCHSNDLIIFIKKNIMDTTDYCVQPSFYQSSPFGPVVL